MPQFNDTVQQEDGTDPLKVTEADVLWIRKQRKADEHATWLRGQVKVIWPWVIGGITAIVAFINWAKDHLRW